MNPMPKEPPPPPRTPLGSHERPSSYRLVGGGGCKVRHDDTFMKIRRILGILSVGIAASSLAADTNAIIGYWRAAKVESMTQTIYVTNQEVMHFATNGIVSIRFRDSPLDAARTVGAEFSVFAKNRLNMRFTDPSPGASTKTLTAYRYQLVGNLLIMESLDLPKTNTWERVNDFTF